MILPIDIQTIFAQMGHAGKIVHKAEHASVEKQQSLAYDIRKKSEETIHDIPDLEDLDMLEIVVNPEGERQPGHKKFLKQGGIYNEKEKEEPLKDDFELGKIIDIKD